MYIYIPLSLYLIIVHVATIIFPLEQPYQPASLIFLGYCRHPSGSMSPYRHERCHAQSFTSIFVDHGEDISRLITSDEFDFWA